MYGSEEFFLSVTPKLLNAPAEMRGSPAYQVLVELGENRMRWTRRHQSTELTGPGFYSLPTKVLRNAGRRICFRRIHVTDLRNVRV